MDRQCQNNTRVSPLFALDANECYYNASASSRKVFSLLWKVSRSRLRLLTAAHVASQYRKRDHERRNCGLRNMSSSVKIGKYGIKSVLLVCVKRRSARDVGRCSTWCFVIRRFTCTLTSYCLRVSSSQSSSSSSSSSLLSQSHYGYLYSLTHHYRNESHHHHHHHMICYTCCTWLHRQSTCVPVVIIIVVVVIMTYLYTDENCYKRSTLCSNTVQLQHALATKASDYTKKKHVFRLQTADLAQYLIQTRSVQLLLLTLYGTSVQIQGPNSQTILGQS